MTPEAQADVRAHIANMEARLVEFGKVLDAIRVAVVGATDGSRLGLAARVTALETAQATHTSQIAALQAVATANSMRLAMWGSVAGAIGGALLSALVKWVF